MSQITKIKSDFLGLYAIADGSIIRVRKNIEKYDIIKKTDKYHTS